MISKKSILLEKMQRHCRQNAFWDDALVSQCGYAHVHFVALLTKRSVQIVFFLLLFLFWSQTLLQLCQFDYQDSD